MPADPLAEAQAERHEEEEEEEVEEEEEEEEEEEDALTWCRVTKKTLRLSLRSRKKIWELKHLASIVIETFAL